jgi:hypothetical protein
MYFFFVGFKFNLQLLLPIIFSALKILTGERVHSCTELWYGEYRGPQYPLIYVIALTIYLMCMVCP